MTTTNQVDTSKQSAPPIDDTKLPNDLTGQVKFATPTDEDIGQLAALRSGSLPWKERH